MTSQTATTDLSSPRYLSATELAKFIRRDLKATFPSVKFSVRSSSYSMGSSVDVSWTDGPTTDVVEPYVNRYAGKSFDGMDDSTHYNPIIVDGQSCSAGSYLHCSRKVSDFETKRAAAEAYIRDHCVIVGDRFGNDWVDNLARGIVYATGTNRTAEQAFQRVVMRDLDA